MNRYNGVILSIIVLGCSADPADVNEFGTREWTEYLGGPERSHYSPLNQIDSTNVTTLVKAWEYHSGDSGQIQCNPIIVDGVLYAMTATVQPFALDAKTGKEIWRVRDNTGTTWYGTSRGVAYWQDGDDKRILYTKESWLYALDATTGKAVMTFGDSGKVSLKSGLGESAQQKWVISNTPGTVYEDLIIMPLRVSEGADAAPGYIQAFNIRTGKLAWVFKTIPHPGEPGYETWPPDAYKNTDVGAANNWSGMSVDRKRGIVYAPTGSAGYDFFGASRIGANLYANSLLALDARTGKLKWYYQFVHHDILDRDAPAPPNLVTLKRNGKLVDAVAQVTKQGYVFVFDRETGESLYPIREVAVPSSDVPGEEAWPTQPIPELPAPYARQTLTASDLSPYAVNRAQIDSIFKGVQSEGPFAPLTQRGTIIFPGLDGGAEWGGAAVDRDGVMYVNSNEMGWIMALKKVEVVPMTPGQQLYTRHCVSCHGADRKGNAASGYPSLVDIGSRMTRAQILSIVKNGKNMMPANKNLTAEEQKALLAYLHGEAEKIAKITDTTKKSRDEYRSSGYKKFLDADGNPAISPPWGTLNAIDLNTGEYRWKKVYGEYPALKARNIPQTGSESYGGPVVTASGLLFIAGTKDGLFRAYNKVTGKLLWETKLPAAAFATPATYEVDGKQYVVLACGGTKLGAAKGESYVAFALPD